MANLTLTTVSTGNTITAAHHNDQNTAISSANDDAEGGVFHVGGGKDGTFTLGAIAGTPSAATIASSATAGLLTGNFTYKISAYNESGHTIASAASSATGAITSKQVDLTLPSMPSNGKGWEIYREDASAGTWYFVGRSVGTGTAYTDNTPAVGTGTAPGSNTTGTTWTNATGEWHFDGDVTIPAGTHTVGTTGARAGILIIRTRGKVTLTGDIDADGAYPRFRTSPVFSIGESTIADWSGTNGQNQRGGAAQEGEAGLGFGAFLGAIGYQGSGGDGEAGGDGVAGVGQNPGGIVVICCESFVGAGTITADGDPGTNGAATTAGGASGGGGSAGGAIIIAARDYIQHTGAAMGVNGGNGGNGAGAGGSNDCPGGGAAGGGYVLLLAPVIETTNTPTATGGTGGTRVATGNTNFIDAPGGGAHSGDGGQGGDGTAGDNGTAGQVITASSATGYYVNFPLSA